MGRVKQFSWFESEKNPKDEVGIRTEKGAKISKRKRMGRIGGE